jgi:hypothetical protein
MSQYWSFCLGVGRCGICMSNMNSNFFVLDIFLNFSNCSRTEVKRRNSIPLCLLSSFLSVYVHSKMCVFLYLVSLENLLFSGLILFFRSDFFPLRDNSSLFMDSLSVFGTKFSETILAGSDNQIEKEYVKL